MPFQGDCQRHSFIWHKLYPPILRLIFLYYLNLIRKQILFTVIGKSNLNQRPTKVLHCRKANPIAWKKTSSRRANDVSCMDDGSGFHF